MRKNLKQRIRAGEPQVYGVWTVTLRDKLTGEVTKTYKVENLIPMVARALFMEHLQNPTPSSSLLATHIALGDDPTAPADGDTTLGNEVYRNAVASRTSVDDDAFITGFFDATEVTGTFEEAGIFMDGTGTVDTGVLLSHVQLASIVKDSSTTLTLDWEIQLRDA